MRQTETKGVAMETDVIHIEDESGCIIGKAASSTNSHFLTKINGPPRRGCLQAITPYVIRQDSEMTPTTMILLKQCDAGARDVLQRAMAIGVANNELIVRDSYVLAANYGKNEDLIRQLAAAEAVIVDWAKLETLAQMLGNGPICFMTCMTVDPYLMKAIESDETQSGRLTISQLTLCIIRRPSPHLRRLLER